MNRIQMLSVNLVLLAGIVCAAGLSQADEPRSLATKPGEEVIELFNGKNLDGLYAYLRDTGYEDPKQVFTVVDGMLHISGEAYGYIATDLAYRDYHLVAEFKLGEKTWEPRKDRARDSGILVHCAGPDGNQGTWMASIEYQIIEGGVGDLLVVGGKYADGSSVPMSLTCEVTKDRDGETVWHQGGERRTFSSGRINWYDRDPDWTDTIGFRGSKDVESPLGEWTRADVICDGGHIVAKVNGKIVNEGFEAFPSHGKILVQSEGAEVFIRRLELHPLKKE